MIDSHHHFWKYNAETFGWITDEMSVIRKDFLPRDLERSITGTGVSGCITVQASQTVEEAEWLLSFATQHPFIKGVVGWVPLKTPEVGTVLDRLANNPHFRGVREIIQGSPDELYFGSSEFQRGIRELTKRGIPYDLLIFQNQLSSAVEFVDEHPNQIFILDHCAKPEIGDTFPEMWSEGIWQLARRENVFCKFSGLVTEVKADVWNVDLLRPYFETVLQAFGPKRLMFGSDWPVCLVRSEYGRWISAVKELAADLSETERGTIFSGTALRAYSLEN